MGAQQREKALSSNDDVSNVSNASGEQSVAKKAKVDLLVIFSTMLLLPFYIIFQPEIKAFVNNGSIPVLIRTVAAAFIEFLGFGFGPALVMLYRKEGFRHYGLVTKNLGKTVVLSAACCLPYLLFRFLQGTLNTYLPFHSIWVAKYLYSSSFPNNVVGLALVALSWGFWEGFSYVVICEKINLASRKRLGWLSPGAIISSIICLAVHGAIGITPAGLLEGAACVILISGMLAVKERTGNAWGCVLIFLFFWNAL